MNKGSHISLAYFLIDMDDGKELRTYKRSLLIGSILPDCRPSFLTKRHTITDTFDSLQAELNKITTDYNMEKGISAYYCKHLGIIMHYIADYFTFPHNAGFSGTVIKHIDYEKELQSALEQELKNEKIKSQIENSEFTLEQVTGYIKIKHQQYIQEKHDILVDCRYITEICSKVFEVMLGRVRVMSTIEVNKQIRAA